MQSAQLWFQKNKFSHFSKECLPHDLVSLADRLNVIQQIRRHPWPKFFFVFLRVRMQFAGVLISRRFLKRPASYVAHRFRFLSHQTSRLPWNLINQEWIVRKSTFWLFFFIILVVKERLKSMLISWTCESIKLKTKDLHYQDCL